MDAYIDHVRGRVIQQGLLWFFPVCFPQICIPLGVLLHLPNAPSPSSWLRSPAVSEYRPLRWSEHFLCNAQNVVPSKPYLSRNFSTLVFANSLDSRGDRSVVMERREPGWEGGGCYRLDFRSDVSWTSTGMREDKGHIGTAIEKREMVIVGVGSFRWDSASVEGDILCWDWCLNNYCVFRFVIIDIVWMGPPRFNRRPIY